MRDSRIRLRADYETGEGEVTFPDEFLQENALMRADLLRDWIGELSNHYEEAKRKIFGEVEEGAANDA